MAGEPAYQSLPFKEAIDFFREKVNLPTWQWDDLWKDMHAKGFMVAGAARNDILADFRGAVDKAISDGATLEDFRKDFDDIVGRYGWSYRGGRNWRSEVIFATNITTAYAAGRYRQMTDPDVLSYRPNWQYRHGDSRVPRPLHLSWDGLVLAWDDPWWKTHYPPNGWGCSCRVFALSDRDLAKQGKEGPDDAPASPVDPRTGEPVGIDKGWGYNVGEAAWGAPIAEEAMAAWRAQGAKAYEPLTAGNWEDAGRPEKVPLDAPQAAVFGERLSTREQLHALARNILGGEDHVFSFQSGTYRYDTLVNAEVLSRHIDPSRSPFLPFITETMTDPYEVWLSFERHKGTGKVVLRQRIVKGLDLGDGKNIIVVANSSGGALEAWTVIPTSSVKYANEQRRGWLVQGE